MHLVAPSHVTVKHSGNLELAQVMEVAKKMRARSIARTMKGTVLEILGTCVSVGCSVNGQAAREIQRKIKEGEIEIAEN